MFFLFGLPTKVKALSPRASTCHCCRTLARQHLDERATRFTLFFIPVLTVSRFYQMTCSNCGQHSTINVGKNTPWFAKDQ